MSTNVSLGEGPAPLQRRARRPSLLGVGTIIWIASELMFFSGIFSAYFTIRAHDGKPWPPPGDHLDLAQSSVITVVLIVSSISMQKGLLAAERGERSASKMLAVLTMVLGIVFLADTVVQWYSVPFSTSTNAFGSLYFVMTGLVGLHLVLGVVAILGLLGRMAGPGGDPGELNVYQACSYYWHFVVVVWLLTFVSLFFVH